MYYYEINNITNGPIAQKRYLAKRTILKMINYFEQDIYLLDEKMVKLEKYDIETQKWLNISNPLTME